LVTDDFYCEQALSGRTPGDVAAEVLATACTIAAQVTAEHGAARVLTNLGAYQDSKRLHFHVSSGEPVDQK
jgi:hypothetical protein